MAVSRPAFLILISVITSMGFAIGFLFGYLIRIWPLNLPKGSALHGLPDSISSNGNPDVSQRLREMIDPENIRRYLRPVTVWVATSCPSKPWMATVLLNGHFYPALLKSYRYLRWLKPTHTKNLIPSVQDKMKSVCYHNQRELAKEPHLAGTKADFRQARRLQQFWERIGLDQTKLDPYQVLLSYPDPHTASYVTLLDMYGESLYTSQHQEPVLMSSHNHTNVVPPYNAYSARGTPQGDLVYVNYGRAEDYLHLKRNFSITVRGKIAIARYGRIARPDKARLAEEQGAMGLILYTDPSDYAVHGPVGVYPDGWWMPPQGVQRGTVWSGGDPLTPGYPAKESAFRESEENIGLPRIPVYPISYQDAKALLETMSGPAVLQSWRGTLPIVYRYGPGFINPNWKVQMNVHMTRENVTIYNAFGFIKGAVEPDRYVLLGNHIDAWVFGAVDPSSGTAVLMEVARVMALMLKQGWRPRRSIIFCGWGAEEFGLIGSREWVEQYSTLLADRAVAYLNVDIAVQGNYTFRGRGLPLLFNLMYEVAKEIENPDEREVKAGRRTLYDTWLAAIPEVTLHGKLVGRPRISSLGSGSDFSPFVNKIGVTSADFRYHFDEGLGISSYPLYHSAYETLHLMETHIDPLFKYHKSVAQYTAEIARRLADEVIIPFDPSELSRELRIYVKDLDYIYGTLMNMRGAGRSLEYLKKAVRRFEEASDAFMKTMDLTNKNDPLAVRRINDQLMALERAFIDENGLPGRPQDKNVVFAQSTHDHYISACFPGLVDSLYQIHEMRSPSEINTRWREVRRQMAIITHHIDLARSILKDVIKF